MINASSRAKTDRGKAGFTLVELQVAMVLTMMIAVLLAGAMGATVQAWRLSTSHQDDAEHRFLVNQFLRRHLNNMRFYRFRMSNQGAFLGFIGERDAVHFIAPYPNHEVDGSLYWWTLKNHWDEERSKSILALEYIPYSSEQEVEFKDNVGISIVDAVPELLILDESVRIESIEYLQNTEGGFDTWLDHWEPKNQPPTAIQLNLEILASERNQTAPKAIVIAPRYSQQKLYANSGALNE